MIRPHYVPLYQSVCTSEKLADLASDSHRLFYVLLLTHCDSWGRSKAGARVLTATVWPMLGKKPSDTEKALVDLERVGLIERYSAGVDQYLSIPDWEEKAGRVGKVDRRGPSLCPEPPPTARRTTPADGRASQDQSCLARAGESEPSRAEPSQTKPKAPPGAVPIPKSIDTPAVRDAWDAYVADRKERRQPVTQRAAELALAKLETWGPQKAALALQRSVERGWRGVFDPDDRVQPRPTQATPEPPLVDTAPLRRAELEAARLRQLREREELAAKKAAAQ